MPMLVALTRSRPGTHPHQPLPDGKAKNAAFYPLRLLQAILDGTIATRDKDRCAHDMATEDWHCTLTMAIAQCNESNTDKSNTLYASSIPKVCVCGGNDPM